MGEALVHISGLSVDRGGASVLHRLDLEITAGAPFAIVGPSGSGKTTLLFAVAGLFAKSAGHIRIAGSDPTRLTPRERAQLVGIVFQDYQLFPHLSVLENVCLAPRLSAMPGFHDRALLLLQALGIANLASRAPHEISGGQKQRVAIARALALGPRVVLFDEPSAALDPQTTVDLARLLVELSSKTQVIVVSHDVAFIQQCCCRGVRLEAGQLVAQGDLEHVLASEPASASPSSASAAASSSVPRLAAAASESVGHTS